MVAPKKIILAVLMIILSTHIACSEMKTPFPGNVINSSDVLTEKMIPSQGAVSVSFDDKDNRGGFLNGEIIIARANDETILSDYVVYWAQGPQLKLKDSNPLVRISKNSQQLIHRFPNSVVKPELATHLLVLTANINGEMSSGASVKIVDKGVPTHTALSAVFNDNNNVGGKLTGTVEISKAIDQSDLTDYVIYWGTGPNSKLSPEAPPLATLRKDQNLLFQLTDMSKPAEASHFLVFTRNKDGEMATGVAVPIVDLGVPKNAASGLNFSDTNSTGGRLSGSIQIAKAIDESDVSQYALYWGKDDSKLETRESSIARIGKESEPLAFHLDNAAIPLDANSLIVFTRNKDGEMATGVSVKIRDLGVPAHAPISASFSDTHLMGGKLSGELIISKANDESAITHYVVYWGQHPSMKSETNANAIAELSKSENLSVNFLNLDKPSDANYFLIFSKNSDGEMNSGISILITDVGVPEKSATSITFEDTNPKGGRLSGQVLIGKAENESTLSHYSLYWGQNGSKLDSNAEPFALVGKESIPLAVYLDNVAIPPEADSLLVFTRNSDGEMATGASLPIIDLGLPTVTAASGVFTDVNSEVGKLSGNLSIKRASDESDITEYVVYWGMDPFTKSKSNSNAIATLRKGSDVLSYSLKNVFIPFDATHFLVFSKNDQGEMKSGGYPIGIVDIGVPVHMADAVSFKDLNLELRKLNGTVTISRAKVESDISHYDVYWGFSPCREYPYCRDYDGRPIDLEPFIAEEFADPIAILPKDKNSLDFKLESDSWPRIQRQNLPPQDAQFLLVYTRFGNGQMRKGISIRIHDNYLGVEKITGAGDLLYAATNNGVFVSRDNGLTWLNRTTSHGLGHNFIRDIFISDAKVYAATESGLSISLDGGETWVNKKREDGLISDRVFSVFASDMDIYCSSEGGVSISRDGGNTWSNKTRDNGLPYWAYKVFVSKRDIFVNTNSWDPSVSRDGGEKFSSITNIGGNSSRAVRQVQGDSIYATFWSPGYPGVSISRDGGRSWTQTIVRDSYNQYLSDLFVKNGVIYATNGKSLYISNDDGGNWSVLSPTSNGVSVSGRIYVSGEKIFSSSGLSRPGILVSADGGLTWEDIISKFSLN